ncbi:MAG: hypothetical protein RSB72_00750 [Bacilli bacterium]
MENKKTSGFGIVLILILLALCGYFIWMYMSDKDTTKKEETTPNIKKEIISDENALKKVQEKYILAIDLYKLKDKFTKKDEKIKIDNQDYYELSDYDKIVDELFSPNGKKEFEAYHKDIIVKKDEKVYLKSDSIIDMDKTYKETTFTKKTITKDNITYQAKSFYDGLEAKEYDFVLVKKDDNWLIDKFHFPYKKTE